MPASEMFVPNNLLDLCQGLQEGIAQAPPDQQDAAGAEARRVLGSDISYMGANRLEIRTLGAFALPDGLSFEEQVYPVVSFDELRLRGHLAQVAYIRLRRIRTLSWMIMEPKIRECVPLSVNEGALEAIDERVGLGFTDDTLRRPLYLPVGMIESVMIAA